MTKTLSLAAALLGATMIAGTAQAQTADNSFVPEHAGTIIVRARVIDVAPEDNSSSVSAVHGHVDVSSQEAPELDLSYFVTDNVALEAIAASTRHSVTAAGTAAGKFPVGDAWVLPPTVTAQYHFFPASRFSPYVGAGLTVAWFYNSEAAGGIVKRFNLDNAIGEAVQVGFDYSISGPWSLNVDVKQIFLSTKAHINGGAVTAKTNLDPLVVGLGVGYRF